VVGWLRTVGRPVNAGGLVVNTRGPRISAAGFDPRSIPLTVAMTDMGLRLILDIAIGGKPLKVVLDTGSVGLRVVASQVSPDAVQRTGPAPESRVRRSLRPRGREHPPATSPAAPSDFVRDDRRSQHLSQRALS
jgi:hypothetical protein